MTFGWTKQDMMRCSAKHQFAGTCRLPHGHEGDHEQARVKRMRPGRRDKIVYRWHDEARGAVDAA